MLKSISIGLILAFFVFLKINPIISIPIISQNLQNSLSKNSSEIKIPIFITMKLKTDKILEIVLKLEFSNRTELLKTLTSQLKSHAESTQKGLSEFLRIENVKFESFWISNQIYIKEANSELISKLSGIDTIGEISEEIVAELDNLNTPKSDEDGSSSSLNEIGWNIKKIGADLSWDKTKGEGVLVANIDCGVRWTHEALIDGFVGAENYGWYDALEGDPESNDKLGHGTHTMGTVCGKGGIGVAPEAKWMNCKACGANGMCNQASLLRCGQFLICPYDLNGENPDCSKAPDIISNSWSSANLNWFDDVLMTWKSVGMIPVYSIGNTGPSCGSARYPGASHHVIAAGGTDIQDYISRLSGRGPYNNFVKPDISGPGINVRSAISSSDVAYAEMSGTSAACPHVAGTVALLKSLNKDITLEQIKEIFVESAEKSLPVNDGNNCGGVNENEFPNNVHGFGRLNTDKSINFALKNFVNLIKK